MAGGDGHVLFTFDLVGHRPGVNLAAETCLPEQRSGPRVERMEIAFATAAEQHIRGSRQDSAVGDVGHRKFPLRRAGLWIDGDHGAVAGCFSPHIDRTAPERRTLLSARNRTRGTASDEAATFLIFLFFLDEDARVV